MTVPDRCRRLADAILSGIGDGLVIDDRARLYIDSCLPGMPLEVLAREICETPDLDIAPLMDLIFFPDEAFQMKVESLLEADRYIPDDEVLIVSSLSEHPIRTTLRESSGPSAVGLEFPGPVIPPFVHRLHISRRIPQTLAETLSTHHPERSVRLKVRIRNTLVEISETAIPFLTSFFLGIHPEDPDLDDCLESVLALLGEPAPQADPFRLLRAKIDSMYKARETARNFEEQLRVHNMETLMHMGSRAPETGVAEAEKKIGLLEKIGDAAALGGVIARKSDDGARHQPPS